jgi:hypothetical protein
LAKLEELGGVEGGKRGCAYVVGVGAVTENCEELEVREVLLGVGEGLDLGGFEEL